MHAKRDETGAIPIGSSVPANGDADGGPFALPRVAALHAAPYRYDLFQAISLLERAAPDSAPIGTGNGRNEGVRFTAHVSLSFSPADIRGVGFDTYAPRYVLSTAALTLAGAQGPLPSVFTEKVIQHNVARDPAMAAFLDIFNHRFLSFLYRGRKKHIPALSRLPSPGAAPDQTPPLLRGIDDLANLRHGDAQDGVAQQSWLQHAGLLGPGPRSVNALITLLRDRLRVPVHARQFVGGWLPLGPEDRFGFHGERARLGGGRALGARIWDQGAGIELTCVVDTRETLERFLPGGEAYALLTWLVRRFLQSPLEVHLRLQLQGDVHAPPRLHTPLPEGAAGDRSVPPLRLGWTSWLAKRQDGVPADGVARQPLPDIRLTLPPAGYAGQSVRHA
ncbi:type VI secretion system baseplate subunit TssG [Robbsia sp. KACC 23696]|uniref:type VI secretion system baseplate subunit TssG n=1 Tax=Robbsia sp. KACC 23696 TaxID=3149231 RepID=UPI00325A8915